jgi:predicted metal-dependent peptidase
MVPQSLAAARLRAVEILQPYTGAAVFALVPVAVPGMGTLGVDKWFRLYYDPAILDVWTNEELAWVVLHEVWHCLMQHAARAEAQGVTPMTARIWNLAGDCVINEMLGEQGAKLPDEGGITIAKLGLQPKRLVEEHYRELLKKLPTMPPLCPTSGDGQGGGEGQGGSSPSDGQSPESQPPSSSSGEKMPGDGDGGTAQPANGRCGSCATGIGEWWEDGPPPNKGAANEAGTAPGLDEAERELICREVARRIKEEASGRGNVPSGMERWADEVLAPPQVDWRTLLSSGFRAALADVAGQMDYSYRRPSRRQNAVPDIVLPAMRRPIPQVAIVIDTSGSMSDRTLGYALNEVNGVIQASGQRDGVRVLSCDAGAGEAKRVFTTKQIELVGGGGTDMRVGIDEALELRPEPDIVLVVSDGGTPWPAHPIAGVRLLVCLIDGDPSGVPSFIPTVTVDTDE